MIKITAEGGVICLSCAYAKEIEGVLIDLTDRADLIGERCELCEKVSA